MMRAPAYIVLYTKQVRLSKPSCMLKKYLIEIPKPLIK